MQIILGTTDFQLNRDSAIAIGKFDGIHIGHKYLVEDIVTTAKRRGISSVVFTFSPSPESLFAGHKLPELTTTEEKRMAFEQMGIDVLIEFPMTFETAATEPDLFITKYLVKQMRAKYIAAGADLSFGKKGLGNAALLEDMSKEYGYECNIIDKILYEGTEISSTLIRETVEKGDMELVTALLGSPYKVSGEVSHGRALGRTIGMPTANVLIPEGKIIGPKGVYYSKTIVDGVCYTSTSNIGIKPTVVNEGALCCETYLYGYDGDLYGKNIEVQLMKFVRPEMKFGSVEELKAQMQMDIAGGEAYHELVR